MMIDNTAYSFNYAFIAYTSFSCISALSDSDQMYLGM